MNKCFLCGKELKEQDKSVEVQHLIAGKVLICEKHPHPKEEVK